jgi:hypothetical protein
MATKKSTKTVAVSTETLTIETGTPNRSRAQSGIYLATLQALVPGSDKFFRVSAKQSQSVRQVAAKNSMVVHAETDIDDKSKSRIFRVK